MNLKTKSILAVNTIIVIVCIVMGVIGYIRAGEVFAEALKMKASADVSALYEILNTRYYGDWHLRNGILFKGEQQMDGSDGLVDSLSQICGSKVTIFNGDTRVATTVKDSAGKRAVGTKASETVINNVIIQGKNFLGKAVVMGEDHYAAYQPIKDVTGKTIGMLSPFDCACDNRDCNSVRTCIELFYRQNGRTTRRSRRYRQKNFRRQFAR